LTPSPLRPTLFLDADDVLCPNTPFGGLHVQRALARPHEAPSDLFERLFSTEAVDVLNQLLEEFSPRVVLTTSWLSMLDRPHFIEVFNRCRLPRVATALHAHWDAPTKGVRLACKPSRTGFRVITRARRFWSWTTSSPQRASSTPSSTRPDALCCAGRQDAYSEVIFRQLEAPYFVRTRTWSRGADAGAEMATRFDPNERQRRLIQQAETLADEANRSGHHAPPELVRRMAVEESAAMFSTEHEIAGGQERDVSAFRIRLAAATEQPVTRDAVLRQLGSDICKRATVFKVPRHFVLLEFEQTAATHDSAITACISAVLRALPEAELIDLTDPNSLIDELVEASEGRAPTARELVQLMRSDAPSLDSFARAAADVDGLLLAEAGRVLSEQQLTELLAAAPSGKRAGELRLAAGANARLIEADVFDVWPELGLARLMSDGGTMFTATERTPGISSLDDVSEGQRYECVAIGRFNLVVYARLVA